MLRRQDTVFLFVIIFLAVIFCFDILFARKTWLPTFILKQMYPWKNVLTSERIYYDGGWSLDALRDWYRSRYQFTQYFLNRELPLWDKSRLWGTPYLADGLSTPFDPLNLLFVILPFKYAFNFYTFLQFTLAGIFIYLFARSLKISPLAGLVSATIFSFSFIPLFLSGFPHFYNSLIWTPLVFYSVSRFFVTRQRRYALLLFFGLVIQLISGSLELSFYSTIFLILFSLSLITRKVNFKLITNQFLITTLFIILLAYSFSSFQILPTIELSKLANRDMEVILRSLPPWHFITLFNPFLFGSMFEVSAMNPNIYFKSIASHATIWQKSLASIFNLYRPHFWHNLYLGGGGLVLLGLSLVKRTAKVKVFWLFLLISLFWSMSGPIYGLIFGSIPIVNKIQTPERMIYFYFLFACLLCGFGYDNLRKLLSYKSEKISKSLIKILFIILSFSYFVYFGVLTSGFMFKKMQIDQALWFQYKFFSPRLIVPIISVTSTSAVLILSIKRKINKKLLGFFLIVIIFTEGLFLRSEMKLASSMDSLFPNTPGLTFLQNQTKPIRVAVLSGGKESLGLDYSEILEPNLLSIYDISEISGHGALNTQKSFRYLKSLEGEGGFSRLILPINIVKMDKLLISGVDYVITAPEYNLNNPRLNLVHKGEDMWIYANELFKGRAYLEKGGRVEINKYANNQVVLTAFAKEKGDLILQDQSYPGWEVYINGIRKELQPTDLFKTVEIERGVNQVVFIYDPPLFRLGVYIAFISLFLFIIWYQGLARYIIDKLSYEEKTN